jgi:minichromosome maintenance protein 10
LPKNNVHVVPQPGSDGGGGATYIVGGNVVSTDKAKRFEQEMIAEKFGRGKQGREKRKREEQEAERELQKLLEQDSGGSSMGAKYLREAQRSAKGKERAASGQGKASEEPETADDRKRPFSIEAVRRIGFNPTVKGSAANVGESADAARKRVRSPSDPIDQRSNPSWSYNVTNLN